MKVIEIKKAHIFLSIIIFFLIIALVVNPEIYMQSTFRGFMVWATAVLPALFPFFFLTKLLTSLNLVEQISKFFEPVTSKFFNVSGVSCYVFLMSVISGYPVGAKLTSELYQSGKISEAEATRMTSFCSTSGPLFIIGTVGVGMFFDKTIGIIMLISHILGAFLNGFLYRNYHKNTVKYVKVPTKNTTPIDNILADTIYDSVISILVVGGYIALFFMIIDVLTNWHILTIIAQMFGYILEFLGLPSGLSIGLSSGIIEVTRGCLDLSFSGLSPAMLCIFGSGLISWGGLSIHFQALTFLQKCKIKMSVYLLQKITHSVLAMLVATLLVLIF